MRGGTLWGEDSAKPRKCLPEPARERESPAARERGRGVVVPGRRGAYSTRRLIKGIQGNCRETSKAPGSHFPRPSRLRRNPTTTTITSAAQQALFFSSTIRKLCGWENWSGVRSKGRRDCAPETFALSPQGRKGRRPESTVSTPPRWLWAFCALFNSGAPPTPALYPDLLGRSPPSAPGGRDGEQSHAKGTARVGGQGRAADVWM